MALDNEFELRRTPHVMGGGPRGVPWLTSIAMWANLLRYVPRDGATAAEFVRSTGLAREDARRWLRRLRRWRYLTIAPPAANKDAQTRDWIVRPTPEGRKALTVWPALLGTIEERWAQPFGKDAIAKLNAALRTVAGSLDANIPDYLPALGYALFSHAPRGNARLENLFGRLGKVLLAFALDFERDFYISLPMTANVLRLLEVTPARVRELPRLSGVSKEALAMALGYLQRSEMATLETDERKARVATLTRLGRSARRDCLARIDAVEAQWETAFGASAIARLRAALEPITGDGTARDSPLFAGLVPDPACWRATIPRPETLPHFPMILHRGGYPDGS